MPDEYNSSYTGVQIDTAVGAAIGPDSSPVSGSTKLVQSGGVYDSVMGRVPVIGMGDNILDNWYFVGGGSQLGAGIFPINRRGTTSNSSSSATNYFIDRWVKYGGAGSASLEADGLVLTGTSSNYCLVRQWIPQSIIDKKTITISALLGTGKLITTSGYIQNGSSNTSVTIVFSDGQIQLTSLANNGGAYFGIRASGTTSVTFVAVKLEFGSQQTLCHNEGTEISPVWAINEPPEYEDELYKCITSSADSSNDTYSGKAMATEQQIATIENGTTASKAYSIGEFFCMGGLLYRVTAAIASGASFVEGTNCSAITVGEAIMARTISTTLFSTLTDVHTDTTVTMSDDFTNYKFVALIFNSRSPAAAAYRIPLTISTNVLTQGGFYYIANSEVSGYVRVNYIAANTKQIRVQTTNISTLYLASILGIR